MIRLTNLIAAAAIASLVLVSCGDDDNPQQTGFTGADLERLSFAPEDLPDMDYQADRSGRGAFTAGGENREIAAKLEKVGLEADHVSQFFATSRTSDPLFAESIVFLFGDDEDATASIPELEQVMLGYLDETERVEGPGVGSEPFGVVGEFDGFPTYIYGWRTGNVVQLLTAAPNEDSRGPARVLELAEQLAAKAEVAS